MEEYIKNSSLKGCYIVLRVAKSYCLHWLWSWSARIFKLYNCTSQNILMTVLVSIILSSIFRHVLVTWIMKHVSRPGFSIDTQTLFYYKSSFLLQKRIENISCISCHKRPKKKPAPVHLAPWTNHVKSFLSSERFISLQVQSVLKKLDFCFVLLGLCLCLLKKKKVCYWFSPLLWEVFLRTQVFPSPQKPIYPNSNLTRNQVDEEPLRGCASSKSLFIYLFIYLFIINVTRM